MIETSSVPPRKSSATFGNLRQSSANVRKISEKFNKPSEQFWKIFGNGGRKSSESRQKLRY